MPFCLFSPLVMVKYDKTRAPIKNKQKPLASHPETSAVGGVAFGVLGAAVEMIAAADSVGDRTASPHARRQLAASAARRTRVTTVGANHVVDGGGTGGRWRRRNGGRGSGRRLRREAGKSG